MHGDVREWVEDCWDYSYVSAPNDGSAWTSGDCGHQRAPEAGFGAMYVGSLTISALVAQTADIEHHLRTLDVVAEAPSPQP
jgi:formylglycine-generating enzyme required for sulfatase activity